MKNIKKNILVLLLVLSSMAVYALPDGWSFSCSGTTGVYEGPNGSWIQVPGHRDCIDPKVK